MEPVTWLVRAARARAYITWDAGLKVVDCMCQRPASTHDTGMMVSLCGGARMVRLRTRFCWAPSSSSPSSKRTACWRVVLQLQLGDRCPVGHLGYLNQA